MKNSMRASLPGATGVVAAAGSALCCAGPVLAVTVGVSGAGLSAFEPLRPYFLGATAFFLVLGFVLLDREERRGTLAFQESSARSPRYAPARKWCFGSQPSLQ